MKTKRQLSVVGQRQWGRVWLLAMFFCFSTISTMVSAATTCPAGYTPDKGVCWPNDTGLSSKPVADIIMNLMNWLLGVLGFIAVLGFVISGIQYLMSAGDEGTAETAKRNMQYSIIGVVVALSGRVIIMAINNLLNVTGTPF